MIWREQKASQWESFLCKILTDHDRSLSQMYLYYTAHSVLYRPLVQIFVYVMKRRLEVIAGKTFFENKKLSKLNSEINLQLWFVPQINMSLLTVFVELTTSFQCVKVFRYFLYFIAFQYVPTFQYFLSLSVCTLHSYVC